MDTALHLHLLGYDLPEIIMNLVESREQILYNTYRVNELVKMYNEIIDNIDPPVVSTLKNFKTFFISI